MTIFTKIDLIWAFHNIPVTDEDIPKTTIVIPLGSFRSMCTLFGVSDTGQAFQRFAVDLL